ncbi:MAG TPA: amylosucrase [Anaerolineae bacterium]
MKNSAHRQQTATTKTVSEAHLSELVQTLLQGPLRTLEPIEQEIFQMRFEQHMPDVLRPLRVLYGDQLDFEECLDKFLHTVARAYADRPRALRLLNLKRGVEPDWFQQSSMIGYVCYADRFAGDLKGVTENIPYLKELGITYLHLMPLLQSRPGPNDGGYAVMNYRCVDPRLGTMEELSRLATELRRNGISLCIDLVCNHTAKEHEWAQKARTGDPQYLDYYITFPDRTMPDKYERTLPEVFPDFAPGNFTYYEDMGRWVWTTFNEYQWDLNYRNPAVFGEMLDIMLFLANQGVEILRLDAVAFMWKRLGTDSQNQPEAHYLLQAFRALTRIAAPGLVLLAEAIVAPEKLIPYLGRGPAANKECELAYHNVYMVMLWSSLAERNIRLMTHALHQMPEIPSGSAWLTYARCHDDIGWAVTDENAAAIGLNGYQHRWFLSDFYSGHFPGTFARGVVFQYNPNTGDRRISGSLASLAGLEAGLEKGDVREIDLAIGRILLLHDMIFVFGGIPVIYMGDEIGMLNDYSYLDAPDLADDNRWLHRPVMDWEKAEERHDPQTITGRIFQGVQHLVEARQQTVALHAQADAHPVWTHNDHVFGLIRDSARGRLLILANFTEHPQTVPAYRLQEMGFGGPLFDWLYDQFVDGNTDIQLPPYGALWLERSE